jgi:hypothetical protein
MIKPAWTTRQEQIPGLKNINRESQFFKGYELILELQRIFVGDLAHDLQQEQANDEEGED